MQREDGFLSRLQSSPQHLCIPPGMVSSLALLKSLESARFLTTHTAEVVDKSTQDGKDEVDIFDTSEYGALRFLHVRYPELTPIHIDNLPEFVVSVEGDSLDLSGTDKKSSA